MEPPQKPLTHAPKNSTRRSKAERDRLEKLESQRQQARAHASAAETAAEATRRRAYYGIRRDPAVHPDAGDDVSNDRKGGLGGSLRYLRGGRGGFMGQTQSDRRKSLTEMKKIEALTRTPKDHDPAENVEEGAGPSSSTRRRTTRRTNPPQTTVGMTDADKRIKADPDRGNTMQGIETQTAAKDGHGYGSSEDEMILGRNIEHINLVSDNENEEERLDGSAGGKSSRRRPQGLQPLRLVRKPHKDRNPSFNANLSSSGAAMHRKDSKGKSAGSGDVATMLRETRRWTGAYEDVDIKEEGVTGEGAVTAGVALNGNEEVEGEDTQSQTLASRIKAPKSKTKEPATAKVRIRKKPGQQPEFQTMEEQREYEKRQQDREDLQIELGQVISTNNESQASGTETNGAAEAANPIQDKKENAVYLFQLPPIIPNLSELSVKQEPSSPDTAAKSAPTASAPTVNPATSGPIKIEDDLENPNLQDPTDRTPHFAAGKVGKFRVHKSGRATLTWGGTSMEVNQGRNPKFLQSVILVNTGDVTSGRGGDPMDVDGVHTKGEAISFGQVRGKLVITPDWNEILG